MPLDSRAVGTTSTVVDRTWTRDDALLYAVGIGADSGTELSYTTEISAGVIQQPIPTLAILLGSPMPMFDGAPIVDVWAQLGDLDWTNVVHGEQDIELYRPLSVAGHVRSTTTITGVYDKGKGAVVAMETRSVDAATGESWFDARTSIFVRGAGGWGGERGPASTGPARPDAEPDSVVRYVTAANQALIYRLSGDRNPLHCDPSVAAAAGFDRPILHGLCTYGFTARALLETLCDHDTSRFVRMSGRFTAPVTPGDELTVAVWRTDPETAVFQTRGRDGVTVIDAGRFVYTSKGTGQR